MYATCFGLYLGQPQACLHKKSYREYNENLKGPFFTVTIS